MVAIVYIAYFFPVALFAIGWVQVLRSVRQSKDVITLSVGSASVFWLAIGGLYPAALGPDYSRVRYALILLNFVAAVASAIISLSRHTPVRWLAGIGCALLALVWAFVGAINSVV